MGQRPRHRLETDRAGTFFLDPAYAFALENPWLAPVADLARHSQALQGMRRLAARWNIESAERYSDAIPVYVSAQHGINVLAEGMGAARVMVLQPFLAFKEPLSVEENGFAAYRYRDEVMRQLYERTSRELKNLAAQDAVTYLDGRFAFRGVSESVFGDTCTSSATRPIAGLRAGLQRRYRAMRQANEGLRPSLPRIAPVNFSMRA